MSKPKDFHILIVPSLERCPEGFRESLMKEGYSTEVCSSISEATAKAPHHRKPILLADCGEDEDLAIEFAKTLVAQKELASVPVFFIGSDAKSLERALQRFFSLVVSLNTPFLRGEGIEALSYICQHYPKVEPLPAKRSADPLRELDELQPLETEEISLTDRDIRTLVFSQLSQVQQDDFGGTRLKNRLTLEDLASMGLLPIETSLKQEIQTVYTQSSRWVREHMCRTAFICDAFHKALALPEELRSCCRDAALLFPTGFNKKSERLLQRNYLVSPESERTDLASKLKDSSLYLIGELNKPKVAKTITNMARYIGQEERPDDSLEALSASLLTAAELIDRICFEMGFWNPRAAYVLIRSATQGKLDFIHPLAAASMMKFLSEALVHMPKTFLIRSIARDNPECMSRARETEAYVPDKDEEKIALDNLEPGMELSQPIYSFDGRKILSGSVQLDQDLIWRLWRLSAIRPMNTPLVVKKSELN